MEKSRRKKFQGRVISDKMQKTIIVRVERLAKHPLYGKVLTKASKYKVHDEKNEAKVGDTVTIQETRPLSKDKYWKLVAVTKKSQPDLHI